MTTHSLLILSVLTHFSPSFTNFHASCFPARRVTREQENESMIRAANPLRITLLLVTVRLPAAFASLIE